MVKSGWYSNVSAREALKHTTIRAKKRLGQHFLHDNAVRDIIITAADLSSRDTVIEIGPGFGVLTTELARYAGKVIAIELDIQLAHRLKQAFKSLSNVDIRQADILTLTPKDIVGASHGYKVVANLPYYITSPVLHHFIQAEERPSLMVVMVQKEVAEAITGRDGKMTALGATMQIYSHPEIIVRVPPESFSPPPKVDSAVLKFTMFSEPAIEHDLIDQFLQTVRAGFSAPRKQLRNSLAHGLDISNEESEHILNRAGIDCHRRAETLNLQEWRHLSNIIWARAK